MAPVTRELTGAVFREEVFWGWEDLSETRPASRKIIWIISPAVRNVGVLMLSNVICQNGRPLPGSSVRS